ncbi:hypothetical protein [Roseimaritima ulvae]|uniref:Carboxypeptidase regulatory-like domain-containing protein n=1 Tax=Roseimaritima ulvae TaxID=980254 RepID=A0A5B9QZU5_9BACT|nr:hypothetical protein [Roseimaritima ulvae]QEG42686.1 hypothetical protein UC8_47280 [Roseimaritima ulvae]
MVRFISAALLLAGLPLLVGCGNDSGLYEVEGTVTHNGQPVPKLLVVFRPDDLTTGAESMGETDEQGNFVMKVGRTEGVFPGPHTVYVDDPAALQGGSSSDDPGYQEVVKKYSADASDYRITIDGDTYDLELKLD